MPKIKNRIVGYTERYRLDPSQVEAGESCDSEITRWGRVLATGPFTALVSLLHNGELHLIRRNAIHTTMPKGYSHV